MYRLIQSLLQALRFQFYTWRVKNNCKSYSGPIRVNRKTQVNKNTVLGSNVNFNGLEITGTGEVIVGNNFHSGRDCLLITQFHKYDGADSIPYSSHEYVIKSICIEDNVWLGDRVIILGGVTLGEGSIIQAGSVVVNSIPAYSIAGGHPARVFKTRDIGHYQKLKADGKFW